ncbi:entericidin A/B family lipoprotein [Parasphingorhabdus sp.]
MQKIIVAFLISSTLVLSACNTVKGVGRDIESVGQAGEEVIN